MNLLLLLSVLTLTAVTFADEGDESYSYEENYDALGELDKLAAECGDQLSLDEDTVQTILDENYEGVEQYNCFLKCMLEKMRFINERGEVQLGNYHEVVPEDDPIMETMAQCQHIVVATCDDALALEKCNDNVASSILHAKK